MFKQYLEEKRGSLVDGYYEKRRNPDLQVQVVSCPSDHSGLWSGLIVKESLGERTQLTIESIAKDKGLI